MQLRREQVVAFVLSVDMDEERSQLLERGNCRGTAADAAAPFPLLTDLALDQDAVILLLKLIAKLPQLAASVNRALTKAVRAPVRTRPFDIRSPSMALIASIIMDFPAPVSPVSALNPG